MKVCFVNTNIAWGGGEKWHYEQAKVLKHAGFEVCFITHPDSALSKKIKQTTFTQNHFKINKLSYLNFFLKKEANLFKFSEGEKACDGDLNTAVFIKKNGNNLETVYSKSNRRDVYCTMQDTEQYIRLDKSFRGYRYYTAFTNEQYHNLILLLRYLTASYDIPREFPNEADRFETKRSVSANMEGIMSHVNFRTDKIDIGPAFDWERVINGVQAEVYGGNPLEDLVKRAAKQVENGGVADA